MDEFLFTNNDPRIKVNLMQQFMCNWNSNSTNNASTFQPLVALFLFSQLDLYLRLCLCIERWTFTMCYKI